MGGLYFILVVAVAGWLTGKMIGNKGYGEILPDYASDFLDIFLGITRERIRQIEAIALRKLRYSEKISVLKLGK
jgi:hypothetical protein